MKKPIIEKIRRQIRQYGFNDYLIMRMISHENQLYLLEKTPESVREVASEQFEITVFLDQTRGKDKYRSYYTFRFNPEEDIDHYLEQARIGAALVKNRYFSLVEPHEYPPTQVFDKLFSAPHRLLAEVSDLIYKHGPARNVTLSSAEVFLSTTDIELHSSTGISAQSRKSKIALEYTLLSSKGRREEEFNVNFVRRNFDPREIRNRITESHVFAKDMLKTRIPSNNKGFVIFRAQDIYELFSPIIFHSSARSKDFGISRFAPGKHINALPLAGEKVSIMSSGILPYGLYSGSFDNEGIAGQECLVVDESVFRKYWATKQYADYTGTKPTGAFKNMVLQKKTKKARRMPEDAYEIVQFSALSPDILTGDFAAEIRFGYHHHNGRKTPIKGGSISGNLFNSLSEIYLSGKSVFEGYYLGPDRIALGNLTIAGN